MPVAALVLGLAMADERYAAVPLTLEGLMPRYMASDAFALARRDESCGQDEHSCRDIGHQDICCSNRDYCYINGTGHAKCCAMGMNCIGDSQCNSRQYQCVKSISSNGRVNPSSTGCCDRRCPDASSYLCPSSLGGRCCHYGEECALNGCLGTRTTLPSAQASETRLTNDAGLPCPTTGQHTCADGTGCCRQGQRCTKVSDSPYCTAALSTMGLESGDDADKTSDSHLSVGAKAGIGIGAGLGGLAIVGAAAWICLVKRLGARSRGPRSVEMGTGVMSESTVSPRPRHGLGISEDYFGPRTTSGPYTATGPPSRTSGVSPGPGRTIPSQSDAAEDYVVPVEMDSGIATGRARDRLSPPLSSPSPRPGQETFENRFELYGGEVNARQPSPSLLTIPGTPTSHVTPKSEC
ncbi:hypothetical protein CDD81_5319 [Ophiocordyceps australis]|uniref:Uncharacterized protein n=1 Tax=Ophiocordyceps australis TaxID=1399860 RepID=A0A2C5YE25_9HYPO|nr:hypothetical protein CDD81_5319 [Ophiocordyceps australis]